MSDVETQNLVPTFDNDGLDEFFEGLSPIPSPILTDSEPQQSSEPQQTSQRQQPTQASPTISECREWTTEFILPGGQQAGEAQPPASALTVPEPQQPSEPKELSQPQRPTQAPLTIAQLELGAQFLFSDAQQAPPAFSFTDPQPLQPIQEPPTNSEPSMQYPPPDAQQCVDPYPLIQKSCNGSLPANSTQLYYDNDADYTQQPISTVTPSTPASHVHNYTAQLKALVDQNWLLYGRQGPPGKPDTEGSYPDALALSSEDESDTRRPVKISKVHKGDKGDQKKERRGSPRLLRANADRDPEKPWVVTNKTKGLNNRAAKIANYKPEECYTALSSAPASWEDFKYTIDGELERGKLYSVAQIEQFLYQHPLHNTANGYDRKNSGLIVWIQKNPADSARRYPTSLSSRCRFADCFAVNNTINQGQYRVTFDEQSHQERNHDPHHNAGYVHLYCLEKLLDFPTLCRNLNVRAENRNLPSELDGKNRMLMSSKAERITADEFIDHCTTFGQPMDYPSHDLYNRPHEGTLTHKLALVKLENEPPTQQRLRAARGQDKKGTALKNHLGNLEIETVERAKTRKAENQNWSTGEPRKRKRSE